MNDNIGNLFMYNSNFYDVNVQPFPFKVGEFLTGDLYEVLRAINGKLLFYHDHIDRLKKSIILSGFNYKLDENYLKKDLITLISKNGFENCNIKVVLSNINNEYYLYAYLSKFSYPDESLFTDGVKTDFLHIERSKPNAKVINAEYKRIVTEAIQNNNLFEVLLVNNDGYITEGSRTNVFIIIDNKVYTAPSSVVLEGITRKYVLKACENVGMSVCERALTIDEISVSDGVFLSGTSIKTLPVNSIGNIKLKTGENDLFKKIYAEFNKILFSSLEM